MANLIITNINNTFKQRTCILLVAVFSLNGNPSQVTPFTTASVVFQQHLHAL